MMTANNRNQNNREQPMNKRGAHQSSLLLKVKLKRTLKVVMPVVALVIAIFLVATPLVLMGEGSDGTSINVIYGLEENEETLGDPVYVEIWDGRGTDSQDCELDGEGPRNTEDGWIHWVFSTKGDSTDARLVLGGTGSGTYEPGEPLNANVWHFYTPYFDLEGLEATVNLYGGDEGPGGGLVISDYCPGSEEPAEPILTIVKEVLDADDNLVEDNSVEFSFVISGGLFEDGETFEFGVDNPKVLDSGDGLELDVEYTIEEVEHSDYEFVSISPSTVTLTEEQSEITVTVVNQEDEPEEPEFGSLVIEKLLKRDAADEEVIPSNKVFTFNIYENETDDLVRENVEVEVVNGEGSVLVDNLPLGVYRVEEVANEAYEVVIDPADGIVDLTEPGVEPVTIEVTNTPRPVLVIEKVLLDADEEAVEDSDVQFTAVLDGGDFDQFEVTFSVNEPAVLDHSDGLEFDVEYTIEEVEHSDYEFVSISPSTVTLTEEESEITVTVVNREEEPEEPEFGSLIIEKVLLDADDEVVEDSDVQFTAVLDGGDFDQFEVTFSVNEPAVLNHTDGLELDVEYTIEEVEHSDYEFVSISPSTVTLTEEESEITVTVVNREEEPEEPEFGSLAIEKLLKRDAADEEVIPSNKVFTFNIYDNETDDLVRENVEVEVVNGEGSVLVDNLPLGVYRVEEVANEAYEAVIDPADGIVDLTEPGVEPVTIEVTNTPRPVLVIEKVLLDADDEAVENSDVQFTAVLDGGDFDQFEVTFSVNEPAVLDHSDGLEFDVEYTVTEVGHDEYDLVGITPDQPFVITDENSTVTVFVINEEADVDDNGGGSLIVLFQPPEPETEPEEEAEEEVQVEPEEPEVEPVVEEEVVLEPEEPATEPEEEVVLEPEEPQTEPEEELIVEPEAPLATPVTDGRTHYTLFIIGALLAVGGFILRKYALR